MVTFKDAAKAFQPKKIKNIVDLDQVDVNLNLQNGSGTDSNNNPFTYLYVEVNGEEFRVPDSVISQLKDILEARPDMQKFKVKKTGAGMATKYTVVGL